MLLRWHAKIEVIKKSKSLTYIFISSYKLLDKKKLLLITNLLYFICKNYTYLL